MAWKVASDLYRELPDVSISDFPRVVNKVNDLIKLFDYRFGLVEKELMKHYEYIQVESYLAEFKALHLKHKEFLLAENLIMAHEVLCDIHSLSVILEKDEFWTRHRIKTPKVKYRLKPDAFLNGPMYKIYSEEYVNTNKGGLFLTRSGMAVREQKQSAEDLYFSISHNILLS